MASIARGDGCGVKRLTERSGQEKEKSATVYVCSDVRGPIVDARGTV